ncbi:MAG: AGE family epimerase/isomerase [Rhodothermales bacterium]|nr:AGE family epimerase/isomerase [Rhodothermales bacterium]
MRRAGKFFFSITVIPLVFWGFACQSPPESEALSLVEELQFSLKTQLLDAWYPRVIDDVHGGYLTDFTYDWRQEGDQQKMIVTQARHVWTLAKAAERYPEAGYLDLAAHGARFLGEVMWDSLHGGFYQLVSREGVRITEGSNRFKTAYGNAFAIYGLAAYAGASGDTNALRLAQRAFDWLETHSYDPEYGGYFQFIATDGTPQMAGFDRTPPKDQNSSIHLMEAFTELYRVWPDERVRRRLAEMLYLIRDTMTDEKGYLRLFFSRDWQPLSFRDSTEAVRQAHYSLDNVSFGHDVETAFLMLDAAEALGLPLDTTLTVGRRMVEHALEYGWDAETGGFYDMGYYLPGETDPTIVLATKTWWAQAEALTTFMVMAQHVPSERQRFLDLFTQQWRYIQQYLIDTEHGDWYSHGLDASPERKTDPKSQIWKGAYHNGRSLMQSIDRINALPR